MKSTCVSKSEIIHILFRQYPSLPLQDICEKDPFKTLIATILSQRSKDSMTIVIVEKLFRVVGTTPEAFHNISLHQLEQLIYQSGTYVQKAKNIKNTVAILLQQYGGKVPHTLEELIALPGVGRKTANIVLNNCFHIPAIAVDIHVHRITNRLGWLMTKTPEKTEQALMQSIPRKDWSLVNHVFVRHGQEICKPIHPQCDRCPIQAYCQYYHNLDTSK